MLADSLCSIRPIHWKGQNIDCDLQITMMRRCLTMEFQPIHDVISVLICLYVEKESYYTLNHSFYGWYDEMTILYPKTSYLWAVFFFSWKRQKFAIHFHSHRIHSIHPVLIMEQTNEIQYQQQQQQQQTEIAWLKGLVLHWCHAYRAVYIFTCKGRIFY